LMKRRCNKRTQYTPLRLPLSASAALATVQLPSVYLTITSSTRRGRLGGTTGVSQVKISSRTSTTATVNPWLEREKMWCLVPVYHWQLEIYVNTRNCQIGVQGPGSRGPVPHSCRRHCHVLRTMIME